MSLRKRKSANHPEREGGPEPTGDGFRAILEEASRREGARKGERTRALLKWAVCALLEQKPSSMLTVAEICALAGVAHGTFYIYFPDRNAVVAEVLEDFVRHERQAMLDSAQGRPDRRAAIRASTAAYYDICAANPGLMRCLLSYYGEFPEAQRIAQNFNRAWIETVVRSAKKAFPAWQGSGASEHELLRRAYALGGMVDQYLAYLFLSRDPNVIAVSGNREEVVESLTEIWERAFDRPSDTAGGRRGRA
jgi:AcrR family transcriptional regulator